MVGFLNDRMFYICLSVLFSWVGVKNARRMVAGKVGSGSLNGLISDLIVLKKRAGLSPGQNRYVDKCVRESLSLQMPKASKRLPDFLNGGEIHALLEESWKDNFTGLLVQFLIFTGLRVGEARNLLVQSLDFGNNQLKVVLGKGGKDRFVPLAPSLSSMLKTHLAGRRSGYVFCHRHQDVPYSVRALEYRVTGAIKKCNFSKRLSTHSLRHTFACMMIAKGMSKEHIQLLMGHSSVKTTEIYAKIELGPVKDEYLRLIGHG